MSEISDILKQFLEELADEIKAKIPHVTGKTADGIEVRITDNKTGDIFSSIKGELLAPHYIMTLEHGRGKTKKSGGGSQSLRESILEWIRAKGFQFPLPATSFTREIKSAEALSWAIAIKIHREGNKLFREGGKSGVLSTVITENRIDAFVQTFNSKVARILLNGVVKYINT